MNMKTLIATRLVLFPVLTLSLGWGLRARASDDAGAGARFEDADTNHDGKISREEFIAGVKNKKGWWPRGQAKANTGQNAATPEMFAAIDTNHDGYLSKEELQIGRRLREIRGDNASGASGTRNSRPAPSESGKKSGAEKEEDRH